AGIGATTSQFGAARVYEDVLKYDPDLVFIEYSVNDNDEAPYERRELFRETYEGLIRKVLSYRSEPAVILLHSVRYDDGSSEEEMHSEVGRYYSLPSISMKQTIYPKTLSGEIKRADITPDNLHPNDVGHELTARVITDIIDLIDSEKDIEEEAYLLPERPLTDNGYEDMKRYNRLNSSPVLDGFIVDTAKQERVRDVFKNGWYSDRKGDSITFKIRGGEIGVMYKKTINKPAPVAIAILDGDETSPIILDANFDETWGDKAYMTTILHAGQDTEHTLKISIRDTFENMASAFYLINVIAGQLIPKG
nr:SGNH/GDSL hydrolase family protein [Lachnospiraceae bacterium]